MKPKTLQYDPLFVHTDEPRVVLLGQDRRARYKHAAEDVHAYCDSVQPKPGTRYVLLLAMSAGEYYGPNRNGDGFSEREVRGRDGSIYVSTEDALPNHYRSFEEHGRPFVHHINSDPSKNYGEIVKAFYNWNMHRVELLVALDIQKSSGQFFMSKIEDGEFPGVSMGCRIPYDVCSVCGHRAPQVADYCEHVSNENPEFGMNRLGPGGVRYFVWNPRPVLFDISFVFRPADRVGYMMKKVAGEQGVSHIIGAHDPYCINVSSRALGAYREDLLHKRAVLRKLSDIDKIIDGEVMLDSGPETNAIRSFVDRYIPTVTDPNANLTPEAAKVVVQSGAGLPGLTHAMFERNSVPSARDTAQVMFAATNNQPTPNMLNAVSGSQGALAGALSDAPEILSALERTGLLDMTKSANLEAAGNSGLLGTTKNRSLAMDRFFRENVPESAGVPLLAAMGRDASPYYSDSHRVLTVKDPRTGRTLETNRRAAEESDLTNKKKWLAEVVGMSALSGVGLKALHGSRAGMLTAPAAALAAGGVKAMSDFQKVPTLETAEGIRIPVNTELIEKRGSKSMVLLPVAGSGALTMMLAHDKARDVGRGTALEGVTNLAQESPGALAAGFAGTATGLEAALRMAVGRHKKGSLVFSEADLLPLAADIGRVIMEYA